MTKKEKEKVARIARQFAREWVANLAKPVINVSEKVVQLTES